MSEPRNALSSPGYLADICAEPSLSANIYCTGRLTELLYEALAPFWRDYRQRSSNNPVHLWFLRYARGGEHLKLRFHGCIDDASMLRSLLEERVASYFCEISDASPPPSGSLSLATPIDLEDAAKENHPDRTLLWTGYRRSHVCFGYEPYLSDDEYVALFVHGLVQASEIVLARSTLGPDGTPQYASRQTLLLHSIIAGLSRLDLSSSALSTYLLYHRDSLLRALRRRLPGSEGVDKVQQLLDRFRKQVDGLGAKADRIALLASSQWSAGQSRTPWETDLRTWAESIKILFGYVANICSKEGYRIDPFAPDDRFPPLFKLLHAFANQVGIDPLNEAFSYHLLLSIAGDPKLRDSPTELLPNLSPTTCQR